MISDVWGCRSVVEVEKWGDGRIGSISARRLARLAGLPSLRVEPSSSALVES